MHLTFDQAKFLLLATYSEAVSPIYKSTCRRLLISTLFVFENGYFIHRVSEMTEACAHNGVLWNYKKKEWGKSTTW